MARFNTKTKQGAAKTHARTVGHKDATTNHAGGLGFNVSPKLELIRRTCAGFLGEPKFYEPSGAGQLQKIVDLAQQVDAAFLFKLAKFARIKMKMRSAPMLLAVLAAKRSEDGALTRAYIPQIVRRADEPGEILAAYMQLYGGGEKLTACPRALLKGLSDAIGNFDEYQLAKYKGAGKALSMRNVFRLVRPVPKTDEQRELYARVVKDELKPAETWENKISTEGSTAENWDEIAASGNMGFMAMLRNLRNFETKGAEGAIVKAITMLQDAEQVQRSKQLPFRFYSALQHVANPKLKDAVRMAMELSLHNLPRWGGSTAIFADLSGSMNSAVSGKSNVTCRDIASLMAAMACHLSEDYVVGAFACDFRVVELSRLDTVLSNAEKIRRMSVGGSTNAHLAIAHLIEQRKVVDRVLILSDMQTYHYGGWGVPSTSVAQQWQEYKRIAPKARLYCLNLNGYGVGNMPEDEPGVMQLTGWSEGIFEFIAMSETEDAMVREIEANW